MGRLAEREYVGQQYASGQNLDARIQLHTRYSVNKYGWFRWVCDHLPNPWPARILELGCGTGKLWVDSAERIPSGTNIVLSDRSQSMVREASASPGGASGIAGAVVADAQAIPWPDDSFGAVLALFMLYHVPDRARALSEVRRVLRPGGRFFASTVGTEHMKELRDLVHRFDPALVVSVGCSEGGFTLQTGAQELEQWFPQVTCHCYEDALEVTEALPLVDYVLSTDAGSVLVGEKRLAFAERVDQELRVRGSIHVTKQSGLFEACL